MPKSVVASILHGAYGDYYEQAVCLKHYALSHPDKRLRLYAASEHRLRELRVLDFGFAESFEHWPAMAEERFDEFFQFQVKDQELREDVISRLPRALSRRLEFEPVRLPWTYLRRILPLNARGQLGLTEEGRARLAEIAAQNGISESTFSHPTVGFLWRYRNQQSAIKPVGLPTANELRRKYERAFSRLIDESGCTVLVCGMKVETTDANRHRIDAKFPLYGLELPPERSVHLKGLSWPLEMELLARTTVCVGHPSGFTEALEIRRGGGVGLLDAPPHYLLKLWYHGMPFFGGDTIRGRLAQARLRHSESAIVRTIRRRLRAPSARFRGAGEGSPSLRGN